jgi:hypothetical protein
MIPCLKPSTRLHLVPHAEAEHEALPDLHRIAIGRANARLVVDPSLRLSVSSTTPCQVSG